MTLVHLQYLNWMQVDMPACVCVCVCDLFTVMALHPAFCFSFLFTFCLMGKAFVYFFLLHLAKNVCRYSETEKRALAIIYIAIIL